MTHTYSTLAVSNAAYQEIKRKLLAANYGHAINAKGEIDMNGIALIIQEYRYPRMPDPIDDSDCTCYRDSNGTRLCAVHSKRRRAL